MRLDARPGRDAPPAALIDHLRGLRRSAGVIESMMPTESLHLAVGVDAVHHFVMPPMPGIMPMTLLIGPSLLVWLDHACGSRRA